MQPSRRELSLWYCLPAIVVAWLVPAMLLAALSGQQVWFNGPTANDDLMRLVQVRDLLAGQDWFDLTQKRLDPHMGVEMHWSRLVDAPIAGLMLLAQVFADAATAEAVGLVVWPMTLLLAFMAGLAAISTQLNGRSGLLTTLAYGAMAVSALAYFAPGRIDHHNVQLVLLVGGLACAVRARHQPQLAVGAGLCAAVMLAIGIESLPYVVAMGAWFALSWACRADVRSKTESQKLRYFGLSFASGTLLLYLLTVPAGGLTRVDCDAVSLAFFVPALLVGGGFALLAAMRPRLQSAPQRLLSLLALMVLLATSVSAINPACFLGPYAELNDDLVKLWLYNVEEAKSTAAFAAQNPGVAYGMIAAPLIGFAAGCYASLHAEQGKLEWRLLTAVLFAALVITMVQMRAAPFANALAVLPCAWLTVILGRFLQARQPAALSGVLFVAVWLSGMNVTHNVVGSRLIGPALAKQDSIREPRGRHSSCNLPGDLAVLQSLPPGRVFNEIDLGPAILAHTQHDVLAGPYHRATKGLQQSLAGFMSPAHHNRLMLRRLDSDYIVLCADGAQARLNRAHPEGMMQQLITGELPDWVERVEGKPGVELLVFRIRKAALQQSLDQSTASSSMPRQAVR